MQPDRPVDARSSPSSFDVIIVGGGHNGLVAAGLLAREGLSVCVCEARELVGGAAISEHPFGPDHTRFVPAGDTFACKKTESRAQVSVSGKAMNTAGYAVLETIHKVSCLAQPFGAVPVTT